MARNSQKRPRLEPGQVWQVDRYQNDRRSTFVLLEKVREDGKLYWRVCRLREDGEIESFVSHFLFRTDYLGTKAAKSGKFVRLL